MNGNLNMEGLNESGIYCITDKLNDKVYVGATGNFRKRYIAWKTVLKRNKCHNPELQARYNHHGDKIFRYEVLEICDPEKLEAREEYWCLKLNSINEGGYNYISPSRNYVPDCVGRKISASNSGKNNWNYGNKRSEKVKAKISAGIDRKSVV